MDGLYRTRRLVRDHFLVLRYYGNRHMPPDGRRKREILAAHLWREAMERLSEVFERKGIIEPQRPHPHWFLEASVYENAEYAR